MIKNTLLKHLKKEHKGKCFWVVDTAPSSISNIKNDAQYIGHTDSEKRGIKVKVLFPYIHQLNRKVWLKKLQNELD